MTEEKTKEEQPKEEQPTEQPAKAGNPNHTEVLEKIELATKQLNDANKQFEHNRALEKAEKVTTQLGGEAEAGTKPELTDKEYAAKVLAGETP